MICPQKWTILTQGYALPWIKKEKEKEKLERKKVSFSDICVITRGRNKSKILRVIWAPGIKQLRAHFLAPGLAFLISYIHQVLIRTNILEGHSGLFEHFAGPHQSLRAFGPRACLISTPGHDRLLYVWFFNFNLAKYFHICYLFIEFCNLCLALSYIR